MAVIQFFFTIFILLIIHTIAMSSYLDSLSPSSPSKAKIPSRNVKRNEIPQVPIFDLDEVAARTPDEHFAKKHPGAGWAGYKHPLYGGYLDALSKPNEQTEMKTESNAAISDVRLAD